MKILLPLKVLATQVDAISSSVAPPPANRLDHVSLADMGARMLTEILETTK